MLHEDRYIDEEKAVILNEKIDYLKDKIFKEIREYTRRMTTIDIDTIYTKLIIELNYLLCFHENVGLIKKEQKHNAEERIKQFLGILNNQLNYRLSLNHKYE